MSGIKAVIARVRGAPARSLAIEDLTDVVWLEEPDRDALIAHIDAQATRIAVLEAALRDVREFVDDEKNCRDASGLAPDGIDDSGGYCTEAAHALATIDRALNPETTNG